MISIIIPTRNEEKAIGATLRGLRKGLRRVRHELIVADDASTDQTRAIARREGAIIAGAKQKLNIASGKNRGAAVARGEYLVFIDADVTIKDPDGFFGEAIRKFEQNPRLVCLGGFIRVVPEQETRSDIFFRWISNNVTAISNNVLHRGGGSGEFQMVRKDAFERIGGFDEKLPVCEDNDLSFRLCRIGETRIDRSLVVYDEGRRPHAVGWLRLYAVWTVNILNVIIFKRALNREWKEIR